MDSSFGYIDKPGRILCMYIYIHMSQSDYIHRKRIANQVASKNRIPINREDNPPILTSQFLTYIKQYEIVNTVSNTNPIYNKLNAPNTLNVMDVNLQIPSTACKTYKTCKNVNM